MEASLSPLSPKATRSKKQKEKEQKEAEEDQGHEQEDDFDYGEDFEEVLIGKEKESGTDKAKAFMDEELHRRMEQLNIPPEYGVFLTDEEITVLREITISMSQDHELVVNLRRAADQMTQLRRKREEEDEAKEEAARIAAREKARKQREEEMKTKGKEKVGEEGEFFSHPSPVTPPMSPVPETRENIMRELKDALDREAASRQGRPVPVQPLDGILDSFVRFYSDLKAKEQHIEETAVTKDKELLQYKEQAGAATKQNKELETSLEKAMADKKLYREELEFALQENMLYAAKRQLDVDQLSLDNRAARRELNRAKQEKEVLGTALTFANEKLEEARQSLQDEKSKAVEWVTTKIALEEDLRQRQSFASELQGQVERLTTGYETATKSLDDVKTKLDALEREKKEAEAQLKEAQDENARTEQLLAISEQKYEQTEKAYKIAMEKKTVTPRAVSARLAQQDLGSQTQTPQRLDSY